MGDLILYKEPLVGFAFFLMLWAVLMSPMKAEVKKRVGKDRYKEIMNEYKKMTRDRTFGRIGILLGIVYLLGSYSAMKSGLSSETLAHVKSTMMIFPFIFVCGGIYCFLMGFVKAMANLLRSSKE